MPGGNILWSGGASTVSTSLLQLSRIKMGLWLHVATEGICWGAGCDGPKKIVQHKLECVCGVSVDTPENSEPDNSDTDTDENVNDDYPTTDEERQSV